MTAATNNPLTPREKRFLALIAQGLSLKMIAFEMGIAYKTADAHRYNAYRKLGIHKKAEAVAYAVNNVLGVKS